MNQKKIALFLPSLRGGGAERSFVDLANGFSSRGFLVDMVLVEAVGPYIPELREGVQIINLGVGRVARAIPQLVRYLRSHRPVTMISGMEHANIIALFARRMAGVPTKLIVSTRYVFSTTIFRSSSFRDRLIPVLCRLMYPQADQIVAVSRNVADDIERALGLPRNSVHVIYNPVVSPIIFEKARASPDHPWLDSSETPVIMGAGRLAPVKDFPTLIRAFHIVRSDRPVRLIILGEGRERTRLNSIIRSLGIEDDVALPGFKENPFSYLARAEVFVLSSLAEGLPGVLIQAMALGIPVISTECPGGVSEILLGGNIGKLVPVGDHVRLADAIQEALDGPRQNMNLQRRALDFTLDKSLQSYIDLINKM